jgi:hypothetical protein
VVKNCLIAFAWLAGGFFLLIFAIPISCRLGLISDVSTSERQTTKHVFPAGEIVSNDSYLESGFRDLCRHNQLYFQQDSSASREKLSDDILAFTGNRDVLPVDNAKLFRYPDHLALVVDSYLFIKLIPTPAQSPPWRQWPLMPDEASTQFLRSFCQANDPRLEVPRTFDGGFIAGAAAFERFPQYHFDHFSDDGKTMILARPNGATQFPLFVVLNFLRYGNWVFGLDATREANHIAAPADPGLVIDIYVVTADAPHLFPQNFNHGAPLSLFGVSKVFSESVPLSSTEWQTFPCACVGPPGTGSISVKFAFWDGMPSYFSLCWQGTGQRDCRMTQLDTWQSPFEGMETADVEKAVYFRVRKP